MKETGDGAMQAVVASAMRKRNGWFCISTANDEDFSVCEADLYNEKIQDQANNVSDE